VIESKCRAYVRVGEEAGRVLTNIFGYGGAISTAVSGCDLVVGIVGAPVLRIPIVDVERAPRDMFDLRSWLLNNIVLPQCFPNGL